MKLNSLNFETWCKNHSSDHEAKWYRELYPFHIFQKIDFDDRQIKTEQIINLNGVQYTIVILTIESQENGRIKTTFDLKTNAKSNYFAWNTREWDNTFQIVYSREGYFITVFSKKEDPSKEIISKFLKGNFTKISLERSLPISVFLLKSLILNIAEEIYPNGDHYKSYDLVKNGLSDLPTQKFAKQLWDSFSPIYSVKRDLWICYSFNEDKAHRIALINANQCEKIIVVYSQPTITKHHRCKLPNSSVLSLQEFSSLMKPELYSNFERQISFIQNHLRVEMLQDKEELKNLIDREHKSDYPIRKSSINESLSLIKLTPRSKNDVFQILCSFNLLNAWLKSSVIEKNKRELYSFKSYLTPFLECLIDLKITGVSVYIENNFALVEIDEFQFSFHNISVSDNIENYKKSTLNEQIIWKGKKLQPIAELLFEYSKVKQTESD